MYNIPYHKKDLENSSFLLTGGAGFIGSNIVEYLIKYGAKKVRVLDNLATGQPSNLKEFSGLPTFEFLEGDIRDLETCKRACEGMDYVSHQAALGSVPRSIKEPENTNAVNVQGTINMLLAARDCGVKKFAYASSSSVYGDEKSLPKIEEKIGNPLSPYAVSKYANELYAGVFNRVYGLPVTGMRYFNIYGPRQDPNSQYAAVIPLFIKGIIQREPVWIDGDGEQTRDFTFVENAVQANILAMLSGNPEASNAVLNIATGQNFSVNRLYEQIKQYLNIEHQSQKRPARSGDIRNSLADISKAKRLLDYNPQFDFSTGLKITVDYFRGIYS